MPPPNMPTSLSSGGPAGRAYVAGRFDDALAAFNARRRCRPDDGPCRVFIDRCTIFLRDGPPPGWNGTWHFDSK